MRLIDADALKEKMEKLYEHHLEMCNYSADGAVSDCIEFLDNAPTIDAAPQWVSVKERLPEDERLVLGLMLGKFCFVGSCRPSDKTWFCATQSAAHPCKKEVTHWMPLPEPPNENADAEEA